MDRDYVYTKQFLKQYWDKLTNTGIPIIIIEDIEKWTYLIEHGDAFPFINFRLSDLDTSSLKNLYSILILYSDIQTEDIRQLINDRKKDEIVNHFVQNFVLKDKRKKCLFELKGLNCKRIDTFINSMNHQWSNYLDMRFLRQIPTKNTYSTNFSFVKEQLNISNNSLCYLLSNYQDLNHELMTLKNAYDKCYGRGLATLIIDETGSKIYLETEFEKGEPPRFIGCRK